MAVERTHAVLGASAAHRWLACPPSARLCEGLPDEPSKASLDGDALHEIAAKRIQMQYCTLDPARSLAEVQEAEARHAKVLAKSENRAVLDAYVAIAIGKIRRALPLHPLVAIERDLDLSRHIPEGKGIADLMIVGGGTLEVVDFKSGRGRVEAAHNPQLMLYALGAMDMWRTQKVETVRTTIIQPRIFNNSTWTIPRRTLERWAKTRLRRTARLAFAGEGELRAGEHCRYCRAKGACPEYVKQEQEKEISKWESP